MNYSYVLTAQQRGSGAVTAHLDVSSLGVEQNMGVGHQKGWVHQRLHWQLSMQPEPLLYLS